MIQEKAIETALLCCMYFYALGSKDDRLAKLFDERRRLEGEIHRLNDVIEDKDFQLQDNDELIQNLNNKLRDGGRTGGKRAAIPQNGRKGRHRRAKWRKVDTLRQVPPNHGSP